MNIVVQCLEDDGVEITLELPRPPPPVLWLFADVIWRARPRLGVRKRPAPMPVRVVGVNRPRQMPGREFVQNDTERKHIHPSVGRIAL